MNGLNQILRRVRNKLNKRGRDKVSKSKKTLLSRPQFKGVVLLVKKQKPCKPNSAQRPLVKVRISCGKNIYKEMYAHVPGENNNIQEHNVVLMHGKSVNDLAGINFRVIRGVYDSTGVYNRKSSRSKYGTKKI